MKARTDLHCYAIRRKNWMNLMKEYPIYKKIMNVKFTRFYLHKVYFPIIRLKQIDIDKFDVRNDFE